MAAKRPGMHCLPPYRTLRVLNPKPYSTLLKGPLEPSVEPLESLEPQGFRALGPAQVFGVSNALSLPAFRGEAAIGFRV